MKLLVDTHTHTVASGHAYSTLQENARAAYEKGLEGFVCADHGPALIGSAPEFIIGVLTAAPEIIEGVRLYVGAEANILDYKGTLDISAQYLCKTDFAIAALHDITIAQGSRDDHTQALIGALRNPYVDVIAHPGNPSFEIDAEAFVKETARQGKVVEINNHSFTYRKGSEPYCTNIMRLCMKHDVRITVSSDAHMTYRVGVFDRAAEILEEVGFPEELVISRSRETFERYLAQRARRLGAT